MQLARGKTSFVFVPVTSIVSFKNHVEVNSFLLDTFDKWCDLSDLDSFGIVELDWKVDCDALIGRLGKDWPMGIQLTLINCNGWGLRDSWWAIGVTNAKMNWSAMNKLRYLRRKIAAFIRVIGRAVLLFNLFNSFNSVLLLKLGDTSALWKSGRYFNQSRPVAAVFQMDCDVAGGFCKRPNQFLLSSKKCQGAPVNFDHFNHSALVNIANKNVEYLLF